MARFQGFVIASALKSRKWRTSNPLFAALLLIAGLVSLAAGALVVLTTPLGATLVFLAPGIVLLKAGLASTGVVLRARRKR